eukprot:527313-Amphidinium_carterae.1
MRVVKTSPKNKNLCVAAPVGLRMSELLPKQKSAALSNCLQACSMCISGTSDFKIAAQEYHFHKTKHHMRLQQVQYRIYDSIRMYRRSIQSTTCQDAGKTFTTSGSNPIYLGLIQGVTQQLEAIRN